MSDNRVEYSEVEWDRCFASLEAQCNEFGAKLDEGSELLVDCRERLSKALREMSVTHEFADDGFGLTERLQAHAMQNRHDDTE